MNLKKITDWLTRTCRIVCLGALLLPCLAAADAPPAGILLYHRDGDQVFLLLADHSNGQRGWGGFGGTAIPGETEAETAARETEEETRGYFEEDWLLERIQNQEPLRVNGFSTFFLEVRFVPAQRVANNPIPANRSLAMSERAHYAWIPLSDVERALNRDELQVDPLYLPPSTQSTSYWEVWIRNVEAASDAGFPPWVKEKESERLEEHLPSAP